MHRCTLILVSVHFHLLCCDQCLKYTTAAGTHTLAVSALPEFDSILRSITGDKFVTALEDALPSDISGAPYVASLDSSAPDVSHIDWTSLLNGPDPYHPAIPSTLPQYLPDTQPLPEIDLSVLQLPCVTPLADSQGDLISKQAKLHQLHAMQEAVRRMEQELQSEGLIM